MEDNPKLTASRPARILRRVMEDLRWLRLQRETISKMPRVKKVAKNNNNNIKRPAVKRWYKKSPQETNSKNCCRWTHIWPEWWTYPKRILIQETKLGELESCSSRSSKAPCLSFVYIETKGEPLLRGLLDTFVWALISPCWVIYLLTLNNRS